MMIAIPIFFVGGVRGDFKYTTRPITMSNAGEYVKDPAVIHLVLNTPFCILRTMQQQFYDRNNFFDEENVATHFNPVQTVSADSTFKYENVVIIILESFGRESIGFYNKQLVNGTYKGYTPFLDSLLGEGRTRLYSFANGRKSIDAIPSVLMSIPAGEMPYILTPYVSNKTQSLPAILKEKGYTTAFFHGAPNGSMGFKALMNLIGVDHYYGKDEYGNDEDFDGTWGIWDEPFFQFSADKINQLKEPFISTIFSVSSHEPFIVPKKYKNKFPKGDHPLRETIGYTDMALRKFFATAQQMSWFKKTLFVITGDHASISYLPEYKTSWGNMAVPVLFYHPGDSSIKKVEDELVQQIDIMPSVLSYLHYPQPFIAFGKNIFDSTTSNSAMNYHNGFQLFKNDYLLQLNGDKAYSMYNYKTDPTLKNNLLNTMKAKQYSMENIIKAFIQQYHNRLINDSLTIK
jgi:phosphoglycerol transferase MdoB-like AlkP superfamily enzyme